MSYLSALMMNIVKKRRDKESAQQEKKDQINREIDDEDVKPGFPDDVDLNKNLGCGG